MAEPDRLVEEIEDLLSRLPSAWAKVVIDARFSDSHTLALYGLDGLSRRFGGLVVRPLAGVGPEGLELDEWAAGVSLLRAYVDRKLMWAVGEKPSKYVEATEVACGDAERAVGKLARLSAELHAGVKLAAGGLLRYLPLALLRRRLEGACGSREGYGMADYRRRGRLYVFLAHSCSLRLPHVLRALGLC